MELTLSVLGIIALIAIIIFSIVAIMSFASINRVVRELSIAVDRINSDFRVVKDKIVDTLEGIDETREKADKVLDDMKDVKEQSIVSMKNFDSLSRQIEKTAYTADNKINDAFELLKPIEVLINTIYAKFLPPINQTASVVSAFSKAFSVFTSKVVGGKKDK